ncbi:MAG: NUDIX hydrolase [Armatimonadetes bacterium]|nr:NUDIX hydrolase [Armatimonadota bacterium]
MPHGIEPSRERRACVRAVRVGVLLYREGRVLAVRHAHEDPQKEYWVLPGGGLEPDESPAEGACREIWEETGLNVRVDRLAYVHDQAYRGERQLTLYFLCSIESGEMQPGAELLESAGGFRNELVWIPPEALSRQRFFPEVLRSRLVEDAGLGFPGEGVYLF